MVDRGPLERFFGELRARVRLARKMDARLDRQLAHRFNVLDYIRTSELGLSRLVGDLLDPKAAHGQELLFLDTLFHSLKRSSKKLRRPLDITHGYGEEDGWTVLADTVRVRLERTIASGRRLDVSVQFEGSDGRTRCLAIENKTWSGDQQNQVRDYLDFLDREYGNASDDEPKGHCLIYLSPRGQSPARASVEPERIQAAKGSFVVWSYSRRVDEDIESGAEDARVRLDYSVSDWLAACRKVCDVDRLRWFLRDAEGYCEREFGGNPMTDTNRSLIDRFLAQPENVEVAATVVERWPDVRSGVVRRFVQHLKPRLEEETATHGTLLCEIGGVTGRFADQWQGIRLFRKDPAWLVGEKRIGIGMEAQQRGPAAWIIGVRAEDRAVRDALESRLKTIGKAKRTGGWPWFNYLNKWDVGRRFDSWQDPGVVKTFVRETRGEGSAVTDFLVERFVELCDRAVPIIDETVHEVRRATA